MFPAMLLVAADCSSIAAAMDATISLTSAMTRDTFSISVMPPAVADCTPAMRALISSVAAAVCCASVLISLATTANPFPADPARAASIVALSASRLVCDEISVMVSVTLPISRAA